MLFRRPYLLAIWHTAGFGMRRSTPRSVEVVNRQRAGRAEGAYWSALQNDCSCAPSGASLDVLRGPRAEARGYYPRPLPGAGTILTIPFRKQD